MFINSGEERKCLTVEVKLDERDVCGNSDITCMHLASSMVEYLIYFILGIEVLLDGMR